MPKDEVTDLKKYAPHLPFNLSLHHDDVARGIEYYLNSLYGIPVEVKFTGVLHPGTGKCRVQFRVTRSDLEYEDPEEEDNNNVN